MLSIVVSLGQMPTYRTICLVIPSGGKTLLKSVVYSPTINTARQERRTNIDIPRPTITPRSGGSKVPPKNNAPANATSRLKFSKLSDTTLVWHLVVSSAWGWDIPFAYNRLALSFSHLVRRHKTTPTTTKGSTNKRKFSSPGIQVLRSIQGRNLGTSFLVATTIEKGTGTRKSRSTLTLTSAGRQRHLRSAI